MRDELLGAAEVQGAEGTLEAVASLSRLLSALLRTRHHRVGGVLTQAVQSA